MKNRKKNRKYLHVVFYYFKIDNFWALETISNLAYMLKIYVTVS